MRPPPCSYPDLARKAEVCRTLRAQGGNHINTQPGLIALQPEAGPDREGRTPGSTTRSSGAPAAGRSRRARRSGWAGDRLRRRRRGGPGRDERERRRPAPDRRDGRYPGRPARVAGGVRDVRGPLGAPLPRRLTKRRHRGAGTPAPLTVRPAPPRSRIRREQAEVGDRGDGVPGHRPGRRRRRRCGGPAATARHRQPPAPADGARSAARTGARARPPARAEPNLVLGGPPGAPKPARPAPMPPGTPRAAPPAPAASSPACRAGMTGIR
jgi:hypothetical protein